MTEEEVLEYSNMIYSITHYFEGYKNKEDLYQAGCLGLVEAYQNFDASYGVKFSTYAYSYIMGEMKKLIREDKGIKISRNLVRLNQQIELAKGKLEQVLMRQPNVYEISEFLGISIEDAEQAMQIVTNIYSIDEPLNNEGKEITLHDTISDNNLDINTLVALKEEVSNLTPFERKILEKRYNEDMTQSEIAESLGINQVQVSRKEFKIYQKIKHNLVA